MYPVLFQIGNFDVRTYSLFLLLAFVIGILLVRYLIKRRTLMEPDIVVDFAFWVIIGVVVGARLAYVFMHWPQFSKDPISIVYLWEGGAVYYGGFILAFVLGFVFMLRKKLPVLPLLDVLAPAVALGEGVGRLGCFFNGCCFGKPTDVCGVAFGPGTIPYGELVSAGEIPRGALSAVVWPTQLFQAAGGVLFFVVLILLMRYVRLRKGQLFGIFLAGFGALRFGINFLRHYENAGNLWTNQIIALVFIAAGIALAIYSGLAQEEVPSPEYVAAERKRMAEEARRKEAKKGQKKKQKR